jgi:hypothetical protein
VRPEPPAGVTRETGPELATAPRAARSRPARVGIVAAAVFVAALVVGALLRFTRPDDRASAPPVVAAPPGSAPAAAAVPPVPAPAVTAVAPTPSVATPPTPTLTPTRTARAAVPHKRAIAPAHQDRAEPSAAEQRGFLRENPFR